jgi:hypothetical protein
MCTDIIRESIAKIDIDILFSTRQFLSHGRRAAVDQCLYRMVKAGEIIRLTPGIFVRAGSRWPSVIAIAAAKAKAFGKQIVQHAGDLAVQFELMAPLEDLIFDASGSSSRFQFGNEIIHLKATANRKRLLHKTQFGQAIRAIWHRGKGDFDLACESALHHAMQSFERRNLPELSALMPAWINDHIVG